MAHRNREKRAEKKAREAQRQENYKTDFDEYDDDEYDDDDYDDDYDDEPKRRRGPHPAIVALIVTTILVGGGFYALNYFESDSLSPVDPDNNSEVIFVVEQGDSTSAVSKALMNNGILKGGAIRGYVTEFFFKEYCKRMGYNIDDDKLFKYGEYTIRKNMTVDEIAEILIAGVAVAEAKRFTILEGYNTKQIARTLQEQGIITEAEFYEEVRNGKFDYPFLFDAPLGDNRLEGFLYPETYEVYEDSTANEVINIMLSQFNELFKPEYYTQAESMGMSVQEVVTLASIVEREAVVADERPIMARVFQNRLSQEMPLESCATIQYVLDEPKEFLTIADTQIVSDYNTYLHSGLPPGPICSPRIASIQATLFPDTNDYLFFVLSSELDGSHMFSTDYNEFLRNKDAYYAAVDAR